MYIEKDNDKEYYREARKIVEKKKKFHNQLASCIGTSIFLLGLNLLTAPGFLWSLIPIMAMGLSIFITGFKLYGPFWKDSNWETRSLEREVERMKKRDGNFRDNEVYYERHSLNPTNTKDEDLDLKEKVKSEKTWNDTDFV